MSRTLLLFGAGASYGSDRQGVPPLGYGLYDRLAQYNPPGWGALPDAFKIALRQDFEAGVIQIANQRSHDLPILQRAMAHFFFSFQPLTSNLYYRLAQDIRRDRKSIALSTLNYERLLEMSFRGAGINLSIGVPPADRTELNFPHGCCHLFCEAARGMASAVSFAGMAVQLNGEVRIIEQTQEFEQRISTDAFPPVMSYFEPKKRTTAGNNFIEDQRERFRQLTQTVECIIVIGIKIREHDRHIWDYIAAAPGRFIYCSGPGERGAFYNWVAEHRSSKNNTFIDGFWADRYAEIYNLIL